MACLWSGGVVRGCGLTVRNRFLDIALVCEVNDDLKNAEAAAVRAVEVKRDCQGDDYPDFDKYVEVLHRVGLEQAMLKA